MERLKMHYLRDLIYRLRKGESEHQITRDLALSRMTVRKYHKWARERGYLEPSVPLPDEAALSTALGEAPRPPRQASSLEQRDEVVRDLLAQGCEMTAITARLRQDYGYTGSYSSVRRYARRICPPEPRITVRVHTAPGEEAQVDPSAGLRAGFWHGGQALRSAQGAIEHGLRLCGHTELQPPSVCRARVRPKDPHLDRPTSQSLPELGRGSQAHRAR